MDRILEVIAYLKIGGAEKVAHDIGFYADKSKYEVHYVVFGDEVGELEAPLKECGCKIFHMPSPKQGYKAYCNNLGKLMDEYKYTAVHAHTMFNIGWVMKAAKKKGVPVRVAHAHSALGDEKLSFKTKLYEKYMRSLILNNATELVACGKAAGIRLYGEEAMERVKVILNGIDTEKFVFSEENRNAVRKELNIEGKFVIGHVGHLLAVKNQSFLLDLMPSLLEKNPDCVLLMLGEGPDREMLEKKIKKLSLEKNVIMTGNVSDVHRYLSAMDVFAFPSLFEGMPLSIVEVQANGLPCILSDRVPRDVFITDLLKAYPLENSQGLWKTAILNAGRNNPQSYASRIRDGGFDVKGVVEKIYKIYEGEK